MTVTNALVDRRIVLLAMPTQLIRQLGLPKAGAKHAMGNASVAMGDPVRLTIQGRTCTMDVLEVPEGVPVLIGSLPLEHLDFVVDLRSLRLIGNPAHGGEHRYELYRQRAFTLRYAESRDVLQSRKQDGRAVD